MAAAAEYVPYSLAEEKVDIEPLVIGIIISFTLFGIGCLQFLNCFRRLQMDSAQDKITFYFLIVLFVSDIIDSVGKGLFITDHLRNIITKGVLGSLTLPHTAYFLCITDGWIAMLNHCVYIYRTIRLTPGRSWITWAIILSAGAVSLAQFAGSIVTGFWIFKPLPTWVATGLVPWAVLWMGGAALADMMLCAVFVYYLRRHKSDFAKTNDLIVRWAALSLETGLLPSALQLATLIIFVTEPNKPWEIVIALFLPKVYVNAILIVVHTVLVNRNPGGSGPNLSSGSFQQNSGGYPGTGVGRSYRAHNVPNYEKPAMVRSHSGAVANGVVVTSEVTYHHTDQVELQDYSEKHSVADDVKQANHPYYRA